MKAEYSVNLLNGNHGIWVLVSKNGKVVFEQAGIASPEIALQYALSVISYEEKEETKKLEAKTDQSPDNAD